MDTEGPNSMVRYYRNPHFAIYIPQYGKLTRGAVAIVDKLFSRIPISYILSSKHGLGVLNNSYATFGIYYSDAGPVIFRAPSFF